MIIVPYHNNLSVSIEFRNRCILESSPPFFRLCSSQLLSVAFDIHQMVRSIEHLDGFRRKKQAAAHTLKLANSAPFAGAAYAGKYIGTSAIWTSHVRGIWI
jgi:hypothetical protein